MYFFEATKFSEAKREVTTFTQALEQLGGILEIIFLMGAFFVTPVNKFLYEAYLIRNLYKEKRKSEPGDSKFSTIMNSGKLQEKKYN